MDTPHWIQERLSSRQIEVARLVATGLTNKAVAEQLYVSVDTVKSHLQSAFTALGVHNRTQLAVAFHSPEPIERQREVAGAA